MILNFQPIRVLLFFTVLISGCEQEKNTEEPRLRRVKYQEVNSANEGLSRTFSGIAKGSQEANLSFKIAGTIESLPVRVGSHLQAGQLIAQLDGLQYAIEVQQAQATLAQMMATQRNALAAFERLKGLYENNNASRNDLDSARASSDSNLALARVARKSLELAQLNLSFTELRSKKVCNVAEVNVENNENIISGQSIVKVSCGQQMEVEISIPGRYVSSVRPEMIAEVAFSNLPGEKFSASVSEVSVASSGGTTFPVTLLLKENPENLRSGMVAEVSFFFSNHKSAENFIIIPAIAVGEDMQGRFVYVVEPTESNNIGLIKRRTVSVKELTTFGLVITEGLKPKDKVVTAGVTVIRDGFKVRIN